MMFMGVYSKGFIIVLKTGCSSPLSLAPWTEAKGTISTSQRKVPKSRLASWCLDDEMPKCRHELMVVIWFIYSNFFVIYGLFCVPLLRRKKWTWSWSMENWWTSPWHVYFLGKAWLSRWVDPNFLPTKGGIEETAKNNMFESVGM